MRHVLEGSGLALGVSRGRSLILPLSLASGLALAGCSADVIRLDSPASFGLNDSSSGLSRPSASMTRSGAGFGALDLAQNTSGSTNAPPPSDPVRMAALPEPVPATPVPSYVPSSAAPASRAAAPSPAVAAAEKGEPIQVQQGDTLYGLSKRHHVAISELMSVNGLSSPNLKPGQTLYLPLGKPAGRKPLTRQPEVAAAPAAAPVKAAAAAAPAPVPEATIAKYDGIYTVKKGDNVYGLALQFHVPPAELQAVNGITDVRKVRPGATLKVPASALANLPAQAAPAAAPVAPPAPAAPSVAAAASEPVAKVPAAVVAKDKESTASNSALPSQPVLLNGEKKVATADTTATDASPAATEKGSGTKVAAAGDAGTAASKLRWPVKGKVIGNFGPRPDGTHNDGVNVSVPLGTEVHAAESGVVAYAGSELKGYGNLILVRHDNGWITAYAHNEEMLAKRGDKVKRGQVIAKAGKSGQVDQPQVHFELRQGSKPVDPSPFMEKI